jgi:1-acyl-sn-glycerol-3-phosphate acyltransferase
MNKPAPQGSDPLDPSNFTRTERHLTVRLLRSLNVLYARVWHRLEVVSPCSLPKSGPAILICNHTSGLDPSLLQSVCPRLIRWMMAKEFYDAPGARRIYRAIGAIPVARSGRDLAATRVALRALSNGHVLGVFPEGRIAPSRDLMPFQAGVALLAIKSGAPVYPARLDGSQRGPSMRRALRVRQHAVVGFGPEVVFDRSNTDRDSLDRATNAIQRAVQEINLSGVK